MKSALHTYIVNPGLNDGGFPHYTLYKNAKKHLEVQKSNPDNYEPHELIDFNPIYECGEVIEGDVNGEPVLIIPYQTEGIKDSKNDVLERVATVYATDTPVEVNGPALVISSRPLNVLKTKEDVEREEKKKEAKPRTGPPKGSKDPEKKKKRKYEDFLKMTQGVIDKVPSFDEWCCSKKE